jgi:hypothetical protein
MAFNEVTNERGLTVAVGAREVELTTAVNRAVAVIVGFTLENPLIGHLMLPSLTDIFFGRPLIRSISSDKQY